MLVDTSGAKTPERIKPLVGVWRYVLGARPAVALSAPLIYACLVPFALLDLCLSIYQAVCFPIYGIPKVRRNHHFYYDRGLLPYLNLLERVNCLYCSYANGVASYAVEIAARTEQHWCPIKHAQPPCRPHSRYHRFLPHADPQAYRAESRRVRQDFRDVC